MPQCEHTVIPASSQQLIPQGHRCPRDGVVEVNGHWYCKQHDPRTVASKETIRENIKSLKSQMGMKSHGFDQIALAQVYATQHGRPDVAEAIGSLIEDLKKIRAPYQARIEELEAQLKQVR